MPKRYWYVIVTYILMQLSAVVVSVIIQLSNTTKATAFTISIYWSISSFIVALIIILILLRLDMKQGSDRGAAGVGTVLLWSVLGVFLAYMAQLAAVMIESFLLGIKPGSENTMEIMEIARAAPIFILIPALIAPILEEIIFRKIIFGTIFKRTNFVIAALASSLIFALVHMDPLHLLTYTAMGFVFAYLYVQTKRIIVPIVAHIAMNTITVMAQFSYTPEEIEKMREQLQMIIIGG